MLGVMPLEKAIEEAKARELDLVEVSPKAVPPVCKIINFGQFLYRQRKADQKNRQKQKQAEIKGIRLGFRIGDHDLEVKEKQARKFIEDGDLIRVVMMFKGREMSHKELGLEKIKEFAKKLEDITQVDQAPKLQGNQVVMILTPKKN